MVTITATPERTLQQRRDALGKANAIRSRRAILKRDLKAGRRDLHPLLVCPPAWLESMKVLELLLAVPKWGRVKALTALRRCEISPAKTVGGLSPRQRRQLADWMWSKR